MKNRKYDLEDRLIEYACRMMDLTEALLNTRAGNYIAGQLVNSRNSPAFNYGEVRTAESPKDFLNKLAVVLKELKECRAALKIIYRRKMIILVSRLTPLLQETEELIEIIGKSISAMKSNKPEIFKKRRKLPSNGSKKSSPG